MALILAVLSLLIAQSLAQNACSLSRSLSAVGYGPKVNITTSVAFTPSCNSVSICGPWPGSTYKCNNVNLQLADTTNAGFIYTFQFDIMIAGTFDIKPVDSCLQTSGSITTCGSIYASDLSPSIYLSFETRGCMGLVNDIKTATALVTSQLGSADQVYSTGIYDPDRQNCRVGIALLGTPTITASTLLSNFLAAASTDNFNLQFTKIVGFPVVNASAELTIFPPMHPICSLNTTSAEVGVNSTIAVAYSGFKPNCFLPFVLDSANNSVIGNVVASDAQSSNFTYNFKTSGLYSVFPFYYCYPTTSPRISCGSIYVTQSSTPITVKFSGAYPARPAEFLNNFKSIIASTVPGVTSTSQIIKLSLQAVTGSRRVGARASTTGFQTTFSLLGSPTTTTDASVSNLLTAVKTTQFNNKLASSTGVSAVSVGTDTITVVPAPADPVPIQGTSSSSPARHIPISVQIAVAVLALLLSL